MKRKISVLILVALAGVLLLFFQRGRDARKASRTEGAQEMQGMQMGVNETGQAVTMLTGRQTRFIGLKLTEVAEEEIEKVIRTVGRVAYDERSLTRINLRVDGWIQDLFVNFTGQEVKKGQPLLTIYSPDLLSTQWEYLLAVRGRERLRESPLPQVREMAEGLAESSRRRLLLWNMTERQIRELERRGEPQTDVTIRSPVNGVVIRRDGTKGMRVTPEMSLYEIADLSTVWVLADIYESEIALVRKGQEARIAAAAYPGEVFSGKVAYIDPFLDPRTRTVRVRVEFPNPGLKLKPEMFAQVELRSPLGRGLLIPESAVLDSGLRQIVFVDKGMEMYEPREIKTRRIDGHYQVLEGLAAGERIVASANFLIDAESKLMASANMMGALGMGGIRMEQAKMTPMSGETKMGGMKMDQKAPKGPQTRKVGDLTLTLSTDPTPLRDGENLLRLKVVDSSGKPVENAKVVFSYTMPMPGMKAVQAPARLTDALYEATAKFGMPGTWEVTVLLTLPGKPEAREKFVMEAVGQGEMGDMPGM